MGRIVFPISGAFLWFGALAALWLCSGAARLQLLQAGISVPEYTPRDVAPLVTGLFSVGFLLVIGSLLQSVWATMMDGLTGGHRRGVYASRRVSHEGMDPLPKLLWGAAAYIAVAGLFAAYHMMFVTNDAQVDGQIARYLTDPAFLSYVMAWPYHLFAALELFGLTPSAFY